MMTDDQGVLRMNEVLFNKRFQELAAQDIVNGTNNVQRLCKFLAEGPDGPAIQRIYEWELSERKGKSA